MFTSDTLADTAGAILFEKAEQRLKTLLAQHGASDPDELPRSVQAEILRRAVVETAVVHFPSANLSQLDHGFRSFAHPAFIPAWERVRASTAIGTDVYAMANGVDAAVLLAGFGLTVAPFDIRQGIIEEPSNDIGAVLAKFSRSASALVGYDSCDAFFYVLIKDCVRTLRKQVTAHPDLFLTSGGCSRATGVHYRLILAACSYPGWPCLRDIPAT